MFSSGFAQELSVVALVGTTLCLTATLTLITVIDLRTFRIPDALSLPLIVAGLSLAVAVSLAVPDAQINWADYFIGSIAAFGLFAGIGEGYFRLRGIDGLGLGDAKLFAAAGAWLGWQNLPVVLLIATIGGLFQALAMRQSGRGNRLAFGPWISCGFLAVWLLTL